MERALVVQSRAAQLVWLGRQLLGRKQGQQQQEIRVRGLSVRAITTKTAPRSPRPQNVDGDFYVDHTCIDCNTCRWMAPTVYKRLDDQSAVHHQPSSEEERLAALQALLACPTASIHTVRPPSDIKDVHATFPLPVDAAILEGVYHCGYHSEKSFAATSYFIVRPDGNILVDSPRYMENLARQFDRMGGVRYMFLTHKDDIADHSQWQEHFKCDRIYHEAEVQADTGNMEMLLRGNGPWSLGSDIDLILTPGHTEGCVSLWYKPRRALFTGDHLGGSFQVDEQCLTINRHFNKQSVKIQIESVRALLPLDFIWLLPGHGTRRYFGSVEAKNSALCQLIAEEETLGFTS